MTISSSDRRIRQQVGPLSFLILLIVVAACVRLGWWQWERAAEFKAAERPIADQPRVPIDQVSAPLINLPAAAEGRLVSVDGQYVQQWRVPEREAGSRSGTWNVALLERSDGSSILVVRGWGDVFALPSGEVSVDGRLMPSQNPELSVDTDGADQLSRVDPALILGTSEIFDGYLIASEERLSDGTALPEIDRVPAPPVTKSPPGYYLQHVAYIVLWWFFGLVAIVVWLRSWLAARRQRDAEESTTVGAP